MHPFDKESEPPQGVSAHLDVRLKPGWRLGRRHRTLVSAFGQSLKLGGRLAGAKILPVVPSLADADFHGLTEDESLLARSLQVVLPPGADPNELAADLRALEGVESVSAPPQIGLP